MLHQLIHLQILLRKTLEIKQTNFNSNHMVKITVDRLLLKDIEMEVGGIT